MTTSGICIYFVIVAQDERQLVSFMWLAIDEENGRWERLEYWVFHADIGVLKCIK